MSAGASALIVERVRDLVRRPPVTCRPAQTVAEIAARMARERIGSVVVTAADGRALGIVTDRDLRGKVVAEGRDPARTRAA